MASLAEQVASLRGQGVDVLLVTSGAVAAGREVLARGGGTPTGKAPGSAAWSWELPHRQVLAAVGQSRLMYLYEQLFAERGVSVAQALVTRRDIADRVGYLNIRNTLLALLELKVVPILNENDVVEVEELEGEVIGDNDTLSALVANIVDADLLVMLGDIAGLYTADPHMHSDARLISRVSRIDQLAAEAGASWNGAGRGGMVAKLAAARLATASGVEDGHRGRQRAGRAEPDHGGRAPGDLVPSDNHQAGEPPEVDALCRVQSRDRHRGGRRGRERAAGPQPQPASRRRARGAGQLPPRRRGPNRGATGRAGCRRHRQLRRGRTPGASWGSAQTTSGRCWVTSSAQRSSTAVTW